MRSNPVVKLNVTRGQIGGLKYRVPPVSLGMLVFVKVMGVYQC